jgi:hypothetical protein
VSEEIREKTKPHTERVLCIEHFSEWWNARRRRQNDLLKSVSWSALVNVGNNESLALTVSGEAANPDEARDIFAFAIGQLIGVANSADEATAPLIRAYVSRLVQTEEARPVEQDAPAPVRKRNRAKITKASDAWQPNRPR